MSRGAGEHWAKALGSRGETAKPWSLSFSPLLPCSPAPLLIILLLIAHCSSLIALAQPASTTPPPDFSAEVFDIARDLRCPVCQGESAGESNAGVAVEMRRIIAEQLEQGKSREEIRAFFVQRYGDWILSQPPARGVNLLVWLSPLLAFATLAFALWRYQTAVKARAARAASDVSEEEIRAMERKVEGRE